MDAKTYLQKHLNSYTVENDECYIIGRYVGCIKTLIEGYMAVTNIVYVKSSCHHRGTSKRLKTMQTTSRTLKYSHSNSLIPIPFMGFLFEIMRTESWKCSVGHKVCEDTLVAANTQPKRKAESDVMCSASIQIRSVKLYSDPALKLDTMPSSCTDKKLQQLKCELLKKMQSGEELPSTVVHFCRFPLFSAHSHRHLSSLDPSHNRLDDRLAAKIKELASNGIYDIESIRSMLRDYVRNTLFAHAEPDEMPRNDNTRFFPSDRTIRNHVVLAVGSVKKIPGYADPRRHSSSDVAVEPVVKEIMRKPEASAELKNQTDGVGLIAVHLGAGYHSDERWPGYKQLCKQALSAGIRLLAKGATAGEAVTAAMMLLEDSELTNAGYGSNLTERGFVECDASVMDGSHVNSKAGAATFGSVMCVGCIKNPVEAAYRISLEQAEHARLSLGRIPPCSLSGTGAENWAKAHGVEMCDKQDMVSESAHKTWQKYQRRLAFQLCETDALRRAQRENGPNSTSKNDEDVGHRLDTVGAVAVDVRGKVAAASSSGGLLMKLPGRVGQAATFGCGCWADSGNISKPSVAISTSGSGEQLIYTSLAKKTADQLQSSEGPYEAVQKTLLQDFLHSTLLGDECERLAGVLALHHHKSENQSSTELVWGHTTRSMLIGHLSTRDKKPEVVVSRLPDNAVPGHSISVSGTWIKVSTENQSSEDDNRPEATLSTQNHPSQVDGIDDCSLHFDEDLTIMWLSNDAGGLSQDQCGVKLSKDFDRKVLPEFEKCIGERWEERKAANPRLFNASKFRIHSFTEKSSPTKQIVLNLGLTCYRDYMETNWAKEVDYLHEEGMRRYDNTQAFLADPLGVAAVVLTSDDKVVIQQRSHWVAEGAGQLDVPGGHPEPSACQSSASETAEVESLDVDDVINEIFSSQLKEIRDEVNIPVTDLGEARLIGLVANKLSGGRAVCYFAVRCSLTADQIKAFYLQGGNETDESTDLQFLPEQEFVYLQRDAPDIWAQFCPDGKAACSVYSVQWQKRMGMVPFQLKTR